MPTPALSRTASLSLLYLCLSALAQTPQPPTPAASAQSETAQPTPAPNHPSPPAATSRVTFYSAGSFLKGGIPGYKHGSFTGRIMDEYDQLAMLTLGHYVTFDLDPGPHTFTANTWLLAKPEGGGHLTLDLIAGKQYFIGAYLHEFGPISSFRLEQRTCIQATEDSKGLTPLDLKHLKTYGRTHVASNAGFPACTSASAPPSPPSPALTP